MSLAVRPKTKANREQSERQDRWEQLRPVIKRIYIDQKRPLSYLRNYLQQEHGFEASERMFKNRLIAWGLSKNRKESDMIEVLRAASLRHTGGQPPSTANGNNPQLDSALHYFKRKGVRDPWELLSERKDSTAREIDYAAPTGQILDFRNESPNTVAIGQHQRHAAARQLVQKRMEISGLTHRLSTARFVELEDVVPNLLQTLYTVMQVAPKAGTTLSPAFSQSRPDWKLEVPTTDQADFDRIYSQVHHYYTQLYVLERSKSGNKFGQPAPNYDQINSLRLSLHDGLFQHFVGRLDCAELAFTAACQQAEALFEADDALLLVYTLEMIVRCYQHKCHTALSKILLQMAALAASRQNTQEELFNSIITSMEFSGPKGLKVVVLIQCRILRHFEDRFGNLHPHTVRMLETFADALLADDRYQEALTAYQRLAFDAGLLYGDNCYQVNYAHRGAAECLDQLQVPREMLSYLQAAVDHSRWLHTQQRDHTRIRTAWMIAGIFWSRCMGKEAKEIMEYTIAAALNELGEEHPLYLRGKLHLQSLSVGKSWMPSYVYRLYS